MRLQKRLVVLFLLLCAAMSVISFFISTMKREGPGEVEGWHRNRSRNIKDYISETVKPHVLPKNFCIKEEVLLVMVMSKPDNFEARSIIRETWAQKRDNVSFVFLLGETKDGRVQAELDLEIGKFSDIIQENFIDHYNNLTLKSVNMLKLFNKHCSASYKYLMKVDDDVFLNVFLVMEMLMKRTSATNVLMGKIVNNTEPYRVTSSKWFVPYEWYPEEKYPDYLCGPSYLMSADVVRRLYETTFETPLFYIEDVYITGMCANKVNLPPQDNSRFCCIHLGRDFCRYKHLFVIHSYTVRAIRQMYEMSVSDKCRAPIRWRDWIYFFNLF